MSKHTTKSWTELGIYIEAGNVYNETGLTPRQLAEQRAELLEALELAREYVAENLVIQRQAYRGYESIGGIQQIESDLQAIDAAIAKAKGEQP